MTDSTPNPPSLAALSRQLGYLLDPVALERIRIERIRKETAELAGIEPTDVVMDGEHPMIDGMPADQWIEAVLEIKTLRVAATDTEGSDYLYKVSGPVGGSDLEFITEAYRLHGEKVRAGEHSAFLRPGGYVVRDA
jgi:hypothetical protein